MAGAKKANPITIKNKDTLPIENSIDTELFKLLQHLSNWIFSAINKQLWAIGIYE